MVVILDAILNFTPSAREPDYPPKFFYLPRDVLPGSRVKMRGHLIAHGIPSAQGLYAYASCSKNWLRFWVNADNFVKILSTPPSLSRRSLPWV